MLRDYPYSLDPNSLKTVFDKFDINYSDGDNGVPLLEFKIVTPDSFIWKFLINGQIYYLYAEDFIESLDTVRKSIQALTKNNTGFEFIKVKAPKKFEDSSPVKTSTTYKKPVDYDNMKLYAADSGFDFVFLIKSYENPTRAYFN